VVISMVEIEAQSRHAAACCRDANLL